MSIYECWGTSELIEELERRDNDKNDGLKKAIDSEIEETKAHFEDREKENQTEIIMDEDFDERENSIFDCGYIRGLESAKSLLK